MQLVTSDSHEVLEVGTYQKSSTEGGGDMCYGDGRPVRFVKVADRGSHEPRSFTLGSRDLAVDPPQVGAYISLTLECWTEGEARVSPRNGRAYIGSKTRWSVASFKVAKAPALQAAG